jgi:biopolymer transport protein ExbB
VAGMIKAFGALAAAGLQIKQLLQLVFLKRLLPQLVLNCCPIISYNFFTSKIDDLTYSIDDSRFNCEYIQKIQRKFETIIYVDIYIK